MKRGEAFLKSKIVRKNKHKISAIPPNEYSKRFTQFMKEKVFDDKDHNKSYAYLFSPRQFMADYKASCRVTTIAISNVDDNTFDNTPFSQNHPSLTLR